MNEMTNMHDIYTPHSDISTSLINHKEPSAPTESNKPERKTKDIEIVTDNTFEYDGYQIVRGEFFSHTFEPSITFNKSKISVNTACVRKLPDVEYVQALVNPDEKKLAIRPCFEHEKDSFRWCTNGNKNKKIAPRQITCRIFFAKIISLMGWNPHYRYKLLGKLIESNGELLFVFDLKTPEIYQRIVKEGEKAKMSRSPIFPAEWKDHFGLPVEEHKKSLQVDIFDGYAVFGIQDKQEKKDNDITHEEQHNEQ